MAKYSVSFGVDSLTLKPTDGKGKDFVATYEEALTIGEAMAETKQDIAKRGDLTRAMLTILATVLQSTRIDGYRGKVALDSGLSKEFKESMRQAEFETLEPLFLAALDAKNASDLDKPEYKLARQNQFAQYIGGLREGGMYARAKATSCLYMGYFGKLPCLYNADGTPNTSKLLGVTAMEKIIANAKTDLAKADNDGLSKRIIDVCEDLKARNEKTHVGKIAPAIIALREMLATFEALEAEERKTALAQHEAKETVKQTAGKAIDKAKGKKTKPSKAEVNAVAVSTAAAAAPF